MQAFPGLAMTVHHVVSGDGWAAAYFSEHGASKGRAACWSGIGIYFSDGAVLTSCIAQEDYMTRARQLKSGTSDPVEAPAVAPWDAQAAPANSEAEGIVRAWLVTGWPLDTDAIRVDDEHITGNPLKFTTQEVEIDCLLSSGDEVVFHAVQTGHYEERSAQGRNSRPRASACEWYAQGAGRQGRLGARDPRPDGPACCAAGGVIMTAPVLSEVTDGLLVITINRPDRRNAIDRATSQAIADQIDRLDSDDSLRAAILTGAGDHFCAGMDLKAFLNGERVELEGRGLAGLTEAPPQKPLIAAVEGYALAGGFEIALACDLIVASETARFGIPEVKRGLIAGSGGLIRLPERMPRQVALEFALTGRMMDAEEAARWGLVSRLAAPGSALDAARTLAAGNHRQCAARGRGDQGNRERGAALAQRRHLDPAERHT